MQKYKSFELTFRGLGNPHDVLKSISERHKLEPAGEPSLQNAIEMARGNMRYTSFLSSFHAEHPQALISVSIDNKSKPLTISFISRNPNNFRVVNDSRPGKHTRHPRYMYSRQDPHFHHRARR